MANAQYKDFIDSLDAKMKAKTLRTIDLLEANGPSLRKPQSEPMEDGIFELRTKQSYKLMEFVMTFVMHIKVIVKL